MSSEIASDNETKLKFDQNLYDQEPFTGVLEVMAAERGISVSVFREAVTCLSLFVDNDLRMKNGNDRVLAIRAALNNPVKTRDFLHSAFSGTLDSFTADRVNQVGKKMGIPVFWERKKCFLELLDNLNNEEPTFGFYVTDYYSGRYKVDGSKIKHLMEKKPNQRFMPETFFVWKEQKISRAEAGKLAGLTSHLWGMGYQTSTDIRRQPDPVNPPLQIPKNK